MRRRELPGGIAPPTKSELKRQAQAVQDLADRLIAAPSELVDRLELPDKLVDAVALARRIPGGGALVRQRQFVAKLMRGLDPELKTARVANYVVSLRRDLLKVAEAIGVVHPALIGPDDVDIARGVETSQTLREVYGYEPGWGTLGEPLRSELVALMCEDVPAPERPPVG